MKRCFLMIIILILLSGGISATQITIGSGTASDSWDFYPAAQGGYNREQYIVTTSELSAAGASAGNLGSLTFDIPNPAELIFPEDQSVYNSLWMIMRWYPVGNSTGYRLYLGTTNPPPLIGDLGNQPAYMPVLDYGQTYYWQVVPYNSSGSAQNCPVWSFSTLPENSARIGTGNEISALPIQPQSAYSYSQTIYQQGDIEISDLQIEKLYYYWNGASAAPHSTQLTVYMGHTYINSFSSAYAWIPVSQLTQVFSGSVSLPATAGWVEIVLNTPFVYDNESNLVIAVDENGPGFDDPGCSFIGSESDPQQSLLATSTSANINPENPGAGIMTDAIPNTVLIFGDLPTPPAAPILVSPPNGATDLPEHGETLVWSENPAGDPATYYTVYMSQNPSTLYSSYVFTNITITSFQPYENGGVPIDNSQTWYWTVKAVNAQGSALNTDYWGFSTLPPQAGISVTPAAVHDSLEIGHNSTQTMCISNPGEVPLDFWITGEDDSDHDGTHLPFDTLFWRYVSSSDGPQAVVATDGDYIYCADQSAVSPNLKIHRYYMNRTYKDYFTIPGVSHLHDLAWDGQYFYGSNGSTTIYKMNFTTAVLVGTITAPLDVYGLAYNPDHNSLWFSYADIFALVEISMTGQVLHSMNTEYFEMYGLAYDNVSGPTPTLWALTSDTIWPMALVQIDPDTGATIQVRDFSNADFAGVGPDSVPGGLEITDKLITGKAVMLCMSANESYFAMELCNSIGWVSPSPRSGTVAAGASKNVVLSFDAPAAASSTGDYSGVFTIHHNAPGDSLEVPVELTIWRVMVPVFNISPASCNYGTLEMYNSRACQFTITNTGDPYIVINEGDIYLAGNTGGNFILNAPGLPVSLPQNGTYSFSVTFTPVSTGAKTATLKVQDHLNGGTLHSLALSGSCIAENIGQVINLQAQVQDEEDVKLTWNTYNNTGGANGWLSYVASNPMYAWGYPGDVFDAVIKYDTNILYGYAGKYLTKVSFYPFSTLATYTVRVWKGNDDTLIPTSMVLSQPVTCTGFQWNEITLSTPILITGTEAIWFGYQCSVPRTATQSFYYAGFDSGPKQNQYAMIYHGVNWEYMGWDCNWCIKGYIQSREAANEPGITLGSSAPDPFTLAPDEPERTLQGYNIYRNGVLLNSSPQSTRSYLDSELPAGTYSYQVRAVYYSGSSGLSSPVSAQILPPVPYPTPFIEDWSNSLSTYKWRTGTSNWSITANSGQESPCVAFSKNPRLYNYTSILKSYFLDATAMSAVKLKFDLSLIPGGISAENILAIEVFDGNAWQFVGNISSLANGGTGWGFTTYVYDISSLAVNRICRIRFVASGSDSYGIDSWLLDNICVEMVPASLDMPVVTAQVESSTLRINWDAIPGADWYLVFKATEPNGPYQMIATRSANLSRQLTFALEHNAFYTVVACAMGLPGRRHPQDILLK